MRIDTERVAQWMSRRRPGAVATGTARREEDRVTFLSGLLDGMTTGAPLAFVIGNNDSRPADYETLRDVYRPNHADYTYEARYGLPRDWRGGGRSSARWTAAVVAAGAIASQWLATHGVSVTAYTHSIGDITAAVAGPLPDERAVYDDPVRCPDAEAAARMADLIAGARAGGDSVGGVVECIVTGMPPGTGNPMFDKISSRLAAAMFAINAVKGFEIGDGFAAARSCGTEQADEWLPDARDPRGLMAASNHSGGIQGGITNGEDIRFRVAFKPTPTIASPLRSVRRAAAGTGSGATEYCAAVVEGKGRHDPCVVPRAVAVVAAMTSLVMADALMY